MTLVLNSIIVHNFFGSLYQFVKLLIELATKNDVLNMFFKIKHFNQGCTHKTFVLEVKR